MKLPSLPDDFLPLAAMPLAILVLALSIFTAARCMSTWQPLAEGEGEPSVEEQFDGDAPYDAAPAQPLAEEAFPEGWTCHDEALLGGGTSTLCSKNPEPDAGPPIEPATDGTWGHGPARVHARECQVDDECPESSPHCTDVGMCRECNTSSQCPGTWLCYNDACGPPQVAEPVSSFQWNTSIHGPGWSVYGVEVGP